MTAPAGLQGIVEEELNEYYQPIDIEMHRGRVHFTTAIDPIELLNLQSVDHLYALIAEFDGIPADPSGLRKIRDLTRELNWKPVLDMWRRFHPNRGQRVTFRASARRDGPHLFKSPQIAGAVGAGFREKTGFPVDLKNNQLEIIGALQGERLTIGVRLTDEDLSRSRRNLIGRSNLQPAIAYAMHRFAEIKPDEVVLDPMCGVATVCVEGSFNYPDAYHFGGEIHKDEVERGQINCQKNELSTQLCQWDAMNLPVKDECIDVVVCDMPFGRRTGSHQENLYIYPRALDEMSRVLKPNGRAVLLSLEKRLMEGLIQQRSGWEWVGTNDINIGGLCPAIYMLRWKGKPKPIKKKVYFPEEGEEDTPNAEEEANHETEEVTREE